MSKPEVVLIVVDPTTDEHPAVERGVDLADRLGMTVELFICDYQPQLVGAMFLDSKRLKLAKEQVIQQHLEGLNELAETYSNVDIRTKAAWDRPLYEGIIREALECDARYVVKDTHYHSAISRAVFTNTDWHLVQSCPAPLWLVKPGRDFSQPSILAAVDPMHEHDESAALDRRLLAEAFEIGDGLGGSVDAFHAFNPFENPEVMDQIEQAHTTALMDLTEKLEVDQERVHLLAGNTNDLLPSLAGELGTDLIVMGAVSRSRLEHAIVGSTAENVLDKLPCDVLIIKPKGFISPVTFKSRPRGYYCAGGT
jgi:universal stress protein E